jgi:hypothetical protein
VTHIFLGIVKASPALVSRFLSKESLCMVCELIEQSSRGEAAIPDSQDLPLTEAGVDVLKQAKRLSKKHHHKIIQPIHLLAGMMLVPSNTKTMLALHRLERKDVVPLLLRVCPSD